MLALLAVAAVAAAPAADQIESDARVVLRTSPVVMGRACSLWDAVPVRRGAPTAGPKVLGELPPANHEHTLLRIDEDGCSVPVIVRRNVSGNGRFAAP